jgi:hypothetical protein
MIEAEFMNKAKFSKLVEMQVVDKKLGYIDAIVEACKLTNIDPEDVKKFISPVVKEKLEAEAMRLNYLPRQNTLFFE